MTIMPEQLPVGFACAWCGGVLEVGDGTLACFHGCGAVWEVRPLCRAPGCENTARYKSGSCGVCDLRAKDGPTERIGE